MYQQDIPFVRLIPNLPAPHSASRRIPPSRDLFRRLVGNDLTGINGKLPAKTRSAWLRHLKKWTYLKWPRQLMVNREGGIILIFVTNCLRDTLSDGALKRPAEPHGEKPWRSWQFISNQCKCTPLIRLNIKAHQWLTDDMPDKAATPADQTIKPVDSWPFRIQNFNPKRPFYFAGPRKGFLNFCIQLIFDKKNKERGNHFKFTRVIAN